LDGVAGARVVLAVDTPAPGRPGRRRTTRRRVGARQVEVGDALLVLRHVDVRGRPGDIDREYARADVRVRGTAGGVAPAILLDAGDEQLALLFPLFRRRGFGAVQAALGQRE
jgi:hypothetical protein